MTKVQCAGQVSWLKSFASSLGVIGPVIQKGLKALLDLGIEYEKMEKDGDNGFKFKAKTANGHVVKVKGIPVPERSNLIDLYVQSEDGTKKEFPHIRMNQIDDKLAGFIEDKWGQDSLERSLDDAKRDFDTQDSDADFDVSDIDSATHIRASIYKQPSGDQYCIMCSNVSTLMTPPVALQTLADVCNDDTFCEGLTESPQSYDICVGEDSYDVTLCEDECVPDNPYVNILSYMYEAMLNLQAIHWNIHGPQFMWIHNMIGDYIYKIMYDIDAIAEINLQSCDSIISPVEIAAKVCNRCPEGPLTANSGKEIATACLRDMIAAFELYYMNVPHDVQSLLDGWIEYWKAEVEFKLKRIEPPIC